MLRNPSRLLFNALFAVGFAALLPLLLPARAPGDSATSEQVWLDTSRDVYVDGELDPSVVTLVAKSEASAAALAVLSEARGWAVVMDPESLEVHPVPLSSFVFDGTGAVTRSDPSPGSTGRAIRIGAGRSNVYLVNAGEQTLVVAPHQGMNGPTPVAELFHAVPSWQRRAAAYAPDPEAVETLRSHDREIEVTVALGTWCGDSRNYVPKLIKSLEEAGNSRIRLDLMAIHRSFTQPSDFIRGQQVTNVPTVIVRQAGVEIGRIVETPGSASIETDLAAILRGSPEAHAGRWQRQAEIARGRYAYHDDDAQRLGSETWEIFSTRDGGRLLHSVLTSDTGEVEIWHRTDAVGVSEFAELTRRHAGELSRTRLWLDDGKLRSLTRGDATGIVEQNLEVPAGTSFLLPGAAMAARSETRLAEAAESSVSRFLLPLDQPAVGRLVEQRSSTSGREAVATGVGEIASLVLETSYDGVEARWWLDETNGMPVRGTISGIGQISLEEMTLAGGEVLASR